MARPHPVTGVADVLVHALRTAYGRIADPVLGSGPLRIDEHPTL